MLCRMRGVKGCMFNAVILRGPPAAATSDDDFQQAAQFRPIVILRCEREPSLEG